ncbi:MAG: sufD [Gammaproteobacteria bacterium]|jgi:Fe-S cluster assembly protein SufD|nr:sufD [Gammaproteobacteria bacterium]
MKQSLEQNLKQISSSVVSPENRSVALNNFLVQGFPTRREENWRYTDLSFLKEAAFTLSENTIIDRLQTGFKVGKGNVHRLVFIDACFSESLSSVKALDEQCTVLPLKQALATNSEIIRKYLANAHQEDTRFLNLNNAFMSDGYVILVPKGMVIENPIHLLFISSDKDNVMSFSRNIILAEENSALTVFEEHLSMDGQTTFANHITQVVLGAGARLDRYKLQNQNERAIHIAQTLVDQKRDSQFKSYQVTLGAALSREDLNISQRDQGASCALYGLYLAEAKQHQDHHTRIDHLAAHGNSVEYYKGVLTGQAKGVFNGKVVVHPNAQKINSQQTNKNLLLSNAAEMNTKPELEIYADDVSCAHGATIGQVDSESLFYLRSRGLDSVSAMSLLVQAFADEIVETFEHKDISDYLREMTHAKMSTHFLS